MQQEFIRLEETLRAICGRGPVYYLPNSGNLGDALIRFGTRKFLRDVGIDCTELSPGSSVGPLAQLRGGTVIYGGGGAWCGLWGGAERKVARFNRRFHVVVLPSTYEKRYALGNTTFFRRDEFESRGHMPDAVFCHDLAFYIGPLSAPASSGTGHFFRTDGESSGKHALPPDNVDPSRAGRQTSDVFPFIAEVAKHAVVHTDRLHVAIAACLLGRELHLYAGSYFKNRAVFLSSMQGRFNNVHFHNGPLGDDPDRGLEVTTTVAGAACSYGISGQAAEAP